MNKLFSQCFLAQIDNNIRIGAIAVFGETKEQIVNQGAAALKQIYSEREGYKNHGTTAYEIPEKLIRYALGSGKKFFCMACMVIKGRRMFLSGGAMIEESQDAAWEKGMKQLLDAHPPDDGWNNHIVMAYETPREILEEALATYQAL
ncbi:MAG: hypothetical protein A2750_01930 [Candidatus Yanofskybacteria bacterium RIFCSPHIGHO2_01_FULL_45_42]|uniref:Uncharacterized protein n=3 Tax=Candidatus Yanofskyibacteriota TaxID=1752733 RepID=A0A1F8F7B4_9BACT|nr:MAG: hypothetical protein A2750_01930 [Candidatus Yanofskybacteria bacterium RIFCSPHIGHO2_01_FULL_45_42]OGN15573.1 MAG: hypothetical protein A3C81_00315 [Candidatus Yanofskybacteria bacterium RIFCSPHIGHO2_02_FULL_46_19]OGN27897.1 MAG: hypothetical protein A3B17_01830 [Candidatus Yanofskybacteria bacterium RIFCSPLOWO2_01_FULL_45_72]OGN32209.1 MAG: hypothetical protein A3J01_01305 [Candidatus Yanofskybacteria bacterium RIFCSPLOWO2_02_FULL_45_18]